MQEKRSGIGKKAQESFMPELVLIIASVIFFVALMVFVSKTANSSAFHEELYAKKVGLIIEAGKPGQVIYLDVWDAYELAKKNGFVNFKSEFLKVDEANNFVEAKLSSRGGYGFRYFSENSVEIGSVNIDEENRRATVVIAIK